MITFCGVFRNEEQNLRRVLEIAKGLGLPIKVVVQQSEDNTVKIAKEYGEVLERPSESPEESKDFLMEQIQTGWTWWLDADELPSIQMIDFVRGFDERAFNHVDGILFPRINYINGKHIEANEGGSDKQFRMMRSSIRWNAKAQGQRIHINPDVPRWILIDIPLYHHRTLEKVERMTKRWNELEPKTAKYCDEYLEKVKLNFGQT
jgi:hypothetical protein